MPIQSIGAGNRQAGNKQEKKLRGAGVRLSKDSLQVGANVTLVHNKKRGNLRLKGRGKIQIVPGQRLRIGGKTEDALPASNVPVVSTSQSPRGLNSVFIDGSAPSQPPIDNRWPLGLLHLPSTQLPNNKQVDPQRHRLFPFQQNRGFRSTQSEKDSLSTLLGARNTSPPGLNLELVILLLFALFGLHLSRGSRHTISHIKRHAPTDRPGDSFTDKGNLNRRGSTTDDARMYRTKKAYERHSG